MTEGAPVLAGGCQCGAVRYALAAAPKTEFCHCRMCQRATGGPFAALSGLKKSELSWTRGAPAVFRSSTVGERGFCRDCGTPLYFAYANRDTIEITTGSLDEPERAPLTLGHFGVESRLSWLRLADGLPEHRTGESPQSAVHTPGFRSLQGEG